MANKRDYYEVLNVAKNATDDEIKKAFRKMAMKYHPDRNKEEDAETRFKEINEAYEVLSNPDQRNVYDRFGHDGLNNQGFSHGNPFDIFNQFFGGGFGGSSGGGFSQSINIEDIFGDFFGGGGQQRKQSYSSNSPANMHIQSRITISFLESIKGTNKEVIFEKQVYCKTCKGTGAKSESDLVTCSVCKGTGQITQLKKTILGTMQTQSICLNCHGKGKIIKEKCKICNGKTYTVEKEKVTIKIPAGIESGDQLQVTGKGNTTDKGTGNLHVKIIVNGSKNFERVGLDIKGYLYVDPVRAIVGGANDIVTPWGKEVITIKKDCKDGDVYKISGKGVTVTRKTTLSTKNVSGDFYGIVKIVDSSKLSLEEIKILEKVANKDNKNVENLNNTVLKEIN